MAVDAAFVESDRIGDPQVDFETTYTDAGDGTGVVTVTHGGGDPVRADRLRVVSDEFVDVPGADQTSPGRWKGSVSGDGGSVVAGDDVTVGVEDDCTVRVVYEYRDTANTIALVRCADLRT